MDGIYKNAQLVAVDTPYLKPLSDEQIVFYNLDINTAVLTFQLLKDNKYPLQISKANSDMHVYLESKNGSKTTQVNIEFIDPLNGIIRFFIENQFLKAATDTWVTGQLYIKAIGRDDTVVLNEFQFYVKDALINKISSDIKIGYIRQIDDLINYAKLKVDSILLGTKAIEGAQINFNTFVSEQKYEMDKYFQDMKTKMDNLSDATQKDVNDKIKVIQSEADEIIQKLGDATNGAMTREQVTNLLSDYVTTTQLETELQDTVNNISTPSQLPDNFNELVNEAVSNRINELNQNKPLFDDNGQLYEINNPDLSTMDFVDNSGYFYAIGPLHTPDGEDTEGMLQVLAYDNYTKVIYSPNETNAIYLRSKLNQVGNNWTDWLNIGSEVEIGTNESYVEENDVDTSIDDSTETT